MEGWHCEIMVQGSWDFGGRLGVAAFQVIKERAVESLGDVVGGEGVVNVYIKTIKVNSIVSILLKL